MNIIVATSSFPLSNRETFLRKEIEEIASMVDGVYLVPLSGNHEYIKEDLGLPENVYIVELDSTINYCLAFLIFFIKNPLKVIKEFGVILMDGRHILRNLFAYMRAVSVIRYIKNNSITIDHIHSHWLSTPSTMAYFLSNFLSVSYSITAHRWDIYDGNLADIKGKTASFIRFISIKGKSDFCEKYFCKKPLVLHMGVKIPQIDGFQKTVKNEVNIITAANLIEIKGHAVLLDAVESLVESGINIQIFLAGEGPLEKEIQEKVNHNTVLKDRVFLLGHVSHNQLLVDYYQKKYQIFVLPSLDLGHGQHEGIPVSLMEAMSYGLTVVGTDAGSVKELVVDGETGFLAIPGDSHSLAEAICRAIDSDQSIQSKAYNYIIERFDSSKNSRYLVNLMEENS